MLSSCLPLRSRRCSIIACEMYASCDATTGGGCERRPGCETWQRWQLAYPEADVVGLRDLQRSCQTQQRQELLPRQPPALASQTSRRVRWCGSRRWVHDTANTHRQAVTEVLDTLITVVVLVLNVHRDHDFGVEQVKHRVHRQVVHVAGVSCTADVSRYNHADRQQASQTTYPPSTTTSPSMIMGGSSPFTVMLARQWRHKQPASWTPMVDFVMLVVTQK